MIASRPADAGDLQAFQPHAPLAEDRDRVADPDAGRLHRRDAVAQRLQARGLAVGDAVVDMHQRDLRQDRVFREAAGQLETDDGPLAAKVATPGATEGTIAAWQLGPRRDSIAGTKAGHARAGLTDARAELVAEELDRSLGLEPAFDPVVSERRDPERELRLGDARLHTEDFGYDVARETGGSGTSSRRMSLKP